MRRPGFRAALVLVSACALAVASDAGAQGRGRGRASIGEACATDVARLCPDARGVELLLCLEGRSADLSPVCRGKVTSRLAQLREHHALVVQACQDEAARFCPKLAPGPGQGLLRCLAGHEAELSESCRAQLAPHRPSPG